MLFDGGLIHAFWNFANRRSCIVTLASCRGLFAQNFPSIAREFVQKRFQFGSGFEFGGIEGRFSTLNFTDAAGFGFIARNLSELAE